MPLSACRCSPRVKLSVYCRLAFSWNREEEEEGLRVCYRGAVSPLWAASSSLETSNFVYCGLVVLCATFIQVRPGDRGITSAAQRNDT